MAITTKPTAKPARPWVVIGLAVAAVLAVIGLSNQRSGADVTPSTLEINGQSYAFEPATCEVTADDFIVTGPGSVDETEYVVTASASNIELAFGVSSEIETPEPGLPWWSTSGEISWNVSDGKVIVADLELVDRNEPDARPADAHLEVTCPTS